MTSPLERVASTSRTTHRTPSVWRVLNKCHKVRNQGEYEGFLNINERLIADLIAATTMVLVTLEALGPL